VVKAFAERYNWNFDVLPDESNKVAYLYGVNSHPRTFLIGKKGEILGVVVGYRDWESDTAIRLIEYLISAGAPSPKESKIED